MASAEMSGGRHLTVFGRLKNGVTEVEARAALAACLVPVRRARRVNPAEALRCE